MLPDFLLKNEKKVLALTEEKTLELAGHHPSSAKMKSGLPLFYRQVIEVIRHAGQLSASPVKNVVAIAKAADSGDEPAMAEAAGQPEEAKLAKTAGLHGIEMLSLGYSLSHVVHAYGAMCQAITEVADSKKIRIEPSEFHALNRCLDVAIAGAVTEFQHIKDMQKEGANAEPTFLAYEMRDALTSVTVALHMIKTGAVGFGGHTGQLLERSLVRMEELIDQSLMKPKLHPIREA
jgi:hypothetical protein